jgi:hypothetical protein
VITGSQAAAPLTGLAAGSAGRNPGASSGPGTGEAEPESTRHPRPEESRLEHSTEDCHELPVNGHDSKK